MPLLRCSAKADVMDGLAAGFGSLVTPHHVGIVVSNLEKAMDAYQATLGSDFSVFETTEENSSFSGSSAGFRLRFGIGTLGPTMVELIEPTAGTTYYSSYLAQHGPGLHHLAFSVQDLEAARNRLDAQGCRCLMSGSIQDLCEVSYYDVPDLACVIEPIQFSMEFPAFLLKNASKYVGKSA